MSDLELAKRRLSWIKFGGRIAAILVAVGVAGEFIVHHATKSLHDKVDKARELEIARLNVRAKEAEWRISIAHRQAVSASIESKVDIAIDRNERWRARQVASGRVFADSQIRTLVTKLWGYLGAPIGVAVRSEGDETNNFAQALRSVLWSAGWQVKFLKLRGEGGAGVTLRYKPSGPGAAENPQLQAEANMKVDLQDALRAADVVFEQSRQQYNDPLEAGASPSALLEGEFSTLELPFVLFVGDKP